MTPHWQLARRAARLNPSTIREILKITERPGIISLAGGLPAAETFPVEAMAAATARVLAEQGRAALQYAASEGHELGLVGREGLQRAEVGGRLHRHRAAGIDQHLGHQIEALLRAGGDEHLAGVAGQALGLHLGGHPLAQRTVAFAGGVLQRGAALLGQHARGGLGHGLDREGLGRGQAAGQRDDAGALGDLQDLADRRRVQARGAARELPGGRHGAGPSRRAGAGA